MRSFLLATLLLPIGLVAGCSSEPAGVPVTQANQAEVALSDVGQMFRQYTFNHHKPPTKVVDFAPLEAVNPIGLKALQDGDVIARSGVVIQDVDEGPATKDSPDEVIAYAKEVPTSGGPVLMHNRTIRQMTAEEFKAAKLAGDGDMAAGAAAKGK
ncbi:hypothetical protein SAMN05444166_1211 [Singulisphaera sp. GP187]|uniref:hypothetical protein n=1 Tax=Singulisphaera sp. GP187 TaxID=1882752 RepID=UPI0009261122|nr:hypothetical protein [Singulisphaera sp. GP187]SIN84024.1 hypothetical protein SAMN05444166_1211 [Singulisphaera sp. GP187]